MGQVPEIKLMMMMMMMIMRTGPVLWPQRWVSANSRHPPRR